MGNNPQKMIAPAEPRDEDILTFINRSKFELSLITQNDKFEVTTMDGKEYSRHWIGLIDQRMIIYIDFPNGYPYLAPFITFATKNIKMDGDIRQEYYNLLRKWTPENSINDIVQLIQNNVKWISPKHTLVCICV